MSLIKSVSNLVNGSPVDSISICDRGLFYGDGLFETLVIAGGRIQQWVRHLRRLKYGCERLAIEPPDQSLLYREAQQLCHGIDHGVLKIIITRGAGGRGYRIPESCAPTRILMRFPWPDHPSAFFESGIEVRLCTTRLSRNPRLSGIKHLNRLEQVMARNEWHDEYQEGLMLDTEAFVVEGTMSNLFLIRDNSLITPDLTHAGVAGIMRERILEAARYIDVPSVIEAVTLKEVKDADSLFFCNSVIGVWPVHSLDDRVYERSKLIDRIADRLALT